MSHRFIRKSSTTSVALQERLEKELVETLYNAKKGDCFYVAAFNTLLPLAYRTKEGGVVSVTVESVHRYDKYSSDLDNPVKKLMIYGEMKGPMKTYSSMYVEYEIVDGKIVLLLVDLDRHPTMYVDYRLRCTACYLLPTVDIVDWARDTADATYEEWEEGIIRKLAMHYTYR